MKTRLSIVITIIIFSTGASLSQKKASVYPQRDYVPNEEIAKKIAEIIWLPIYGEKIYKMKPFMATLKDSSIWIVRGTLNPQYTFGGTPYIEIQKKDCKILKVTHGK